MENCLKTQLKESVNNDTLETLGIIKFPMIAITGTPARIRVLGSNIEIEGSGYFTDVNGTQNYGKSSLPGNELYILGTDNNSKLVIKDKYDCTSIRNIASKQIFKNSGTFDVTWMSKLSDLNFYNYYRNGLKLDIEQWASYSITMSTLTAYYMSVIGSVENVVENQLNLGRNTGTITFDIQASAYTNVTFNSTKVFQYPSSNVDRLLIIFNSADDVVVKLNNNIIGSYDGTNWTYNS